MNQHEWYRPSTAATSNNANVANAGGDSLDTGGAMGSNGRLEARVGRSRIWKRILDHCFDNSDRRQYGMGVSGRMFGKSIRSMRNLSNLQKHDVNQVSHLISTCSYDVRSLNKQNCLSYLDWYCSNNLIQPPLNLGEAPVRRNGRLSPVFHVVGQQCADRHLAAVRVLLWVCSFWHEGQAAEWQGTV